MTIRVHTTAFNNSKRNNDSCTRLNLYRGIKSEYPEPNYSLNIMREQTLSLRIRVWVRHDQDTCAGASKCLIIKNSYNNIES